MNIALAGFCPDRTILVLAALLRENGKPFVSGKFEGDFFVSDESVTADISALITSFFAKPSAVIEKKLRVDEIYDNLYYSNTTAEFPSGPKVIQLRDETDFRSFERVVLAAITRQAARREVATVDFRTEDNVTQTLPASEFIPVALDILDAKQAVWKVKTAHKDAINELTEEQAALYDETVGWPETNEPVWVMEERASKIYKDMIRRRANRAMESGDDLQALTIRKTIGE